MQQKKNFSSTKKIFFLISFCTFVLISSAQIIVVNPYQISLSNPEISPQFILKNKIKSISAALVTKPDDKPIVDKGLSQYYQFDSINGLLSYSYFNINEGNNVFDTIPSFFYYDAHKHLDLKRTNEGNFYDSWYYVYDSLGRKIKQTNIKETNLSKNPTVFKLGQQYLLSIDSCTFQQLTKTQLKKYFFNDEKKPYKESIVNFNKKGNEVNEQESFIYSWVRIETTCKYDSIGRVSEYDYNSNASGQINEITKYHYDKNGNVDDIKKYDNINQTHEIAYLYNDSTETLTAMIDRNYLEKNIVIVKYSYTYFTLPPTNSFK